MKKKKTWENFTGQIKQKVSQKKEARATGMSLGLTQQSFGVLVVVRSECQVMIFICGMLGISVGEQFGHRVPHFSHRVLEV